MRSAAFLFVVFVVVAPSDLGLCLTGAFHYSVKFKQSKADLGGAVFQFFTDTVRELHRKRVQHVATDSAKALVRQVLPKPEPCMLRDKLKSSMEFWNFEDRNNCHFFMDQVKATYTEVANYVEDRCQPGNKECLGSDRPQGGTTNVGRHINSMRPEDKGGEDPLGSRNNNQGPSRKSRKRKSAELTQKWPNPRCEKTHRVMECEDATDDDNQRLIKDHFNARKKPKAASIRRSPLGDGRWKAVIEDRVEAIAPGHYGADESALPLKVTKVPSAAEKAVELEKFDEPIHLSPTVDLRPV